MKTRRFLYISLTLLIIFVIGYSIIIFLNQQTWKRKIDKNYVWEYSFVKKDSSSAYSYNPLENKWNLTKKDSTIELTNEMKDMIFFIQTKIQVEDLKKINGALLIYNNKFSIKLFINNNECFIADKELISSETFSLEDSELKEIDIYDSWSSKKRFLSKNQISSFLKRGENTITLMVYGLDKLKSVNLNNVELWFLEENMNLTSFQEPEFKKNSKGSYTTSNVPTLKINTFNQVIPDDPKISSNLSITFGDEKTKKYDIKIEKRGYTSQSFSKKSYGFTTYKNNKPKKVKLLNLPSAKKWILYGPYADKSLIRNILTYSLYKKMGYYTPQSQCVELIINNNYQGLYWLMEKISIGENHLNIDKLEIDSIGRARGGYLLEMGRFIWKSSFPMKGDTSSSIFYYDISSPKKEDLPIAVIEKIQSQLYTLEKSLYYKQNYLDHIDINSFVDFFIINELSKNDDAYRMSTYFYNKDINADTPKFFMGPIWDFNFAYGLTHVGANPEGFVYNSSKHVPFWWKTLMSNSLFVQKLQTRYSELRKTTLSAQTINNTIDSLTQICKSPSERNFKKWNVLGSDDLWPNYYIGKTYEEEIDYLKIWLNKRLIFLDENLMKK